jgi:hypothetical protein
MNVISRSKQVSKRDLHCKGKLEFSLNVIAEFTHRCGDYYFFFTIHIMKINGYVVRSKKIIIPQNKFE